MPHAYVPSVEGDETSGCKICDKESKHTFHEVAAEIVIEPEVKETTEVVDEPADVVVAEAETVEVVAADDAEDKAVSVKMDADPGVVAAVQAMDVLLDDLMGKLGMMDPEDDGMDGADCEMEVVKGLSFEPVEGATEYRIKISSTGEPYIEAYVGEVKVDPWFPHVYDSTSTPGREGMCALCGQSTDANIHIPFPAGMPADQLDPKMPGGATQPAGATDSTPALDPVKPAHQPATATGGADPFEASPKPKPASQPATATGSPTAGGPLDPPMPLAATQPATATDSTPRLTNPLPSVAAPTATGGSNPAGEGVPNPAKLPNDGSAPVRVTHAIEGGTVTLSAETITAGEIEASEITAGTIQESGIVAEANPDQDEPEVKVDVSLLGSFEDTMGRLSAAIQGSPPAPSQAGAEQAMWIEATFPDHVLACVAEFTVSDSADGDMGMSDIEFLGLRYFSYPYSVASGAVALGDPQEVEVSGVVSPKTGEPEEIATKAISSIEDKVGRTLSGSNAEKIRQAVQALIEVLSAAGIEVVNAEGEKSADIGFPAHLLMQNDLLRMLADA